MKKIKMWQIQVIMLKTPFKFRKAGYIFLQKVNSVKEAIARTKCRNKKSH